MRYLLKILHQNVSGKYLFLFYKKEMTKVNLLFFVKGKILKSFHLIIEIYKKK